MRLTKASKSLKGKHVRVLTPFELRDGETRFAVNEILVIDGVWQGCVHVVDPATVRDSNRYDGHIRYARRIPVSYFELAENPGPPPAPPPPRGPKRHTSVSGLLLISPTGAISVGPKLLQHVLREFADKNVRINLTVVD